MQNNRAKQFQPFDALTGFKEELRKSEKIRVDRIILSSDERDRLDSILSSIKKGDQLEVRYYKNQNYLTVNGSLTKIDYIEKKLYINKTPISIFDVLDIKHLC